MNESPATQKALTGAEVVRRLGVEPEPTPAPSPHRFPDGAHFRIEIPSVEGPEALGAVIDAADKFWVRRQPRFPGQRGHAPGGAELNAMAELGAERGMEVSLFVGPREEWDLGASSRSAGRPRFRRPYPRRSAASLRVRRRASGPPNRASVAFSSLTAAFSKC